MNKLKASQYICLGVLFLFGVIHFCSSKKADFKTVFKEAETSLNLPINYAQGVDLIGCYVDDKRNALIYVFSVTDAIFENLCHKEYDNNAKSAIISTISERPFCDELCKSGMGYVVKYKSQSGKEKEIIFTNDELVELVAESKSDAEKDFLTAKRQEIGASFYPIDFGDILCLNGIVSDNSVTYEFQYTDSIDTAMITPEFIAYQKETMKHSVKDSAQPYIDEMIEKGYTMNYIMRNSNGKNLFKISFSGNDLK